jgi:hypothetical protein
VKAVFIFPHVSLTAQELSGKLFGEIPRVTYPLYAACIIVDLSLINLIRVSIVLQ